MKTIPFFLFFIFSISTVLAQDFYLNTNGVTCMCPDAAVGDTGVVNGVTYTKRTRQQITTGNASTTCTSGITNMSSLFNQVIFNEDITSWDVSNVTDMNQMFAESFAFNQPIGYWDVSSVTNMNGMFFMDSAFNQPIGDWNVSQVTDMTSMFNEGSFNQPIDSWDVSNVTQMSGMFFYNSAFNQPLNSWNTSNVGNMLSMFSSASSFNQDLNNWNVSNVVQMAEMFAGTTMNGLIDSWDVSSVIDMHGMFQSSPFNQDLNNWDVSSVQNMEVMFWESSFNQPIGDWNVLNVINMYNMFIFTNFNQDISNWQFNTSVNLQGMMNHTLISIENYDLLLASMYNQPLVNKEFGDFSLSFCNISDHDALINEKGWTFEGGQPVSTSIIAPESFISEVDSGACIATNIELGTPIAVGCGTLTISNNAPTVFPIGQTQVVWTLVDENGFETTDTQTVTVTLPVDIAEICYITSDEVEVTKNRVFLYNLDGLNVDNYEIRRETSTGGVYETVGFIVPPENSFLDNSSNNNSQTYRYLINTTDICGATSPDSDYHKTILLQSSVATDNSVNLSWNPYIGISLSTYNIFRRVNNGSYELLISLPSTSLTYNDTEADVLSNDYGYYVSIDVANCTGIPFNPIALKSNRQIIGNLIVNDWDELEQSIILFPNPSSLVVTVKLPNELMLKEVMILNNLGQVISKYDTSTFDTEFLASGLYYLQIVTDKGTFNKSLIKE